MDEAAVTTTRRGRAARFTREDLVRAINRVGFLEFSLAEVARELRVTTSALYRVVPSREAAIGLCLEEVFAIPPVVSPDQGIAEAVHQLCAAYWDTYCEYPGLSTMVLTFPYSPRTYISAMFDLAKGLIALGLDEETCQLVMRHVPVVLAAHHVVFEHQTRDTQRAIGDGVSIVDRWASHGLHKNPVQGDPSQLGKYSPAIMMSFETAWEAISLILKGLGIPADSAALSASAATPPSAATSPSGTIPPAATPLHDLVE